jgi:indolepyruvate ferredoxin oxidoreductase alpha subunit
LEGRQKPKALLGSEGSARGAFEAGARLATGYPGTPTTEAIEYLLQNHKADLRVEWALNEKVAFDIATGHSWAGQRSFVALKMSGLNVASDSVLSVVASGVRGGMVILVGDDPGVYYGMVEQDTRLFSKFALIPCVEPGTPEEARKLTFEAFAVSESVGAPIILRVTTATANVRGPVNLEQTLRLNQKSSLPDDLEKYTKVRALSCQRQHQAALDRLAEAGEALDHWNVLTHGTERLGVVGSASTWSYVEEFLRGSLKGKFNTLKVSVTNPLPEKKLLEILTRSDKVLVVEELEPVIEDGLRILAQRNGLQTRIIGKAEKVFSSVGIIDPDLVEGGLRELLGAAQTEIPSPPDLSGFAERKLNFCPGCPHRSTYTALSRAIREIGKDPKKVMVTGDIGCTILGMNPPFSLCRTEVSMGASIGMAQGFAYAGIEQPIIASIGDSTFFHAGIPALLNASARNVNMTVLVLDNSYAAMTGHQPTPSTDSHSNDLFPNRLQILDLVKAANVRRVSKVLPYFHDKLRRVLVKAMKSQGVNVVIAEAPCASRTRWGMLVPYRIKPEKCRGFDTCEGACIKSVGCPAIERTETGMAAIDTSRCMGCGLCATACSNKAIVRDVKSIRNRRKK